MIRGFACGVFDLFHAGHVLMLKECKEHCDYLIVALNSCEQIDYAVNPNKNKPIYSIEERKIIIESCKFVDEVLIYNSEKELETILYNSNINIRFLGEDYIGKPITAADAVKEIHYTDRSHGLSTSLIRNKLSNIF
jgi:glycerol-3-phosphate cytidylyltransferase